MGTLLQGNFGKTSFSQNDFKLIQLIEENFAAKCGRHFEFGESEEGESYMLVMQGDTQIAHIAKIDGIIHKDCSITGYSIHKSLSELFTQVMGVDKFKRVVRQAAK